MAQSVNYFGLRHGSTRSHTYQSRAGVQITQDTREDVKNPRTLSQMEHRCLIHTMSDAHSWLRPIFGNLWNGARGAARQLAAFRAANYDILRRAALGGSAGFTFSPYERTTMPLGYFQVTHGSLPYRGHLFANGVNGNDFIYTEFFNATQEGASWYQVLRQMGLSLGDTLMLFVLVLDPAARSVVVDTFRITMLRVSDFIIGQQGLNDPVFISPVRIHHDWRMVRDANRILSLQLSHSSFDASSDVLCTCCFQYRKDGSRLLCSDGFLWHWSDNVQGLQFADALATYPGTENLGVDVPFVNNHLFVDMGLPSGTLWATRDIDVTQPNGFAASPFQYEKSFFSWGNIEGYNPVNGSFNGVYNWGRVNEQEPWYEGQPYGFTIGSTLENDIPVNSEFDAASANLGGSWRMPSSREFEELFANIIYIDVNGNEVDTTSGDKRVTVNGVLGLFLQSKINGNRLFFSCSGYGSALVWVYLGTQGRYWSSSFGSSRLARSLFFNDGRVSPQYSSYRSWGFPIRPVFTPTRGLPKSKPTETPQER